MHHPVPTRASHGAPWLLVAIVVTLSVLAAACGSSKSTATSSTQAAANDGNLPAEEGTPVDGGQLVWGLEAETDGLSPSSGRLAVSGHMLASAIFDPLVTLDGDGKTVPYLAESLTPNADNTQWAIKLRSGITFHDGEPLDSAALLKNLQAAKDSIITSGAMLWISQMAIADPLTVTVTMNQPWATFPSLFTGQVGYIAAPKQIDDFYGGDHPIGTGPFVFKEWVKNDHFTATKNPNYWRTGLPHLNEITFKPVPDARQRMDELNDGTLDAIQTLTPSSIDELRATSSLNRLEYTRGEASFVSLNTAKPPFDNILARQAMAYATNSPDYIAKYAPGVYAPTNGVYAEGNIGYVADTGYPAFDLDKAKALVAQYTAATGQPLAFTYTGTSNIDDSSKNQLLKEMWEAAGMQVTLAAVAQGDQVVQTVLGQYQATDFRLFNQPDPDNDWVWLSSQTVAKGDGISLNIARYSDPTVDAGINGGRSTTDPATRQTDYENANKALEAGLPYIFLARGDGVIGASPRVHGYAAARNGSIQTLGPKTWMADLWVG